MTEYKINLEKLKKEGIEPEVWMRLKDGTIVTAKITEVEKGSIKIVSK